MSKISVRLRPKLGFSNFNLPPSLSPFSQSCSNQDVFESTLKPALTTALLDNKPASHLSLLCYGPTGAGKTFTLFGSAQDLGVFDFVLEALPEEGEAAACFELACVELYNEEFRDLLGARNPRLVSVDQRFALTQVTTVRSTEKTETRKFLSKALETRKARETAYNATSSRSHLIVMLTGIIKEKRIHFTFVDLAGSERIGIKCGYEHIKETICINRSLFFLTEIVSRLAQQATVVPYRYCKLTQVLSTPLLVGDHVAIVVNVSSELPASVVRGAVRFAAKAAAVNIVRPADEEEFSLRTLVAKDAEIRRLRKLVAQLRQIKTPPPPEKQKVAAEEGGVNNSENRPAVDNIKVVRITAADPQMDALIERLDQKREAAVKELGRIKCLVLSAAEGKCVEGDGEIEVALRKLQQEKAAEEKGTTPELQKARETIIILKRLLKERSTTTPSTTTSTFSLNE